MHMVFTFTYNLMQTSDTKTTSAPNHTKLCVLCLLQYIQRTSNIYHSISTLFSISLYLSENININKIYNEAKDMGQ